MFIEVEERYSGKTTRLVEDAYQYLLSDEVAGKICVVAYKMQIAKAMKNLILDRIKTTPNITKDQYYVYSKKILVSTRMNDVSLRGSIIDKYYVDEFDYMDLENIVFHDNCYLTSSINETGSSIILNDTFLKKYKNDVNTRKYKIEKVLADDDVSFIEFLNSYYNFNIKESVVNILKNKQNKK
jgi:hypothetical protein